MHGQPSDEKLKRLRGGMTIDGEAFSKCKVSILKQTRNSWYEVVISQGRNRQIRRMFEHIGHSVMCIKRIAIGSVHLGDLPPGGSRRMLPKEVRALRETKKGIKNKKAG